MKPMKLMAATAAVTMVATGAFAQANLTAETASPGGATYLSPAHMTEIAGTQGIANIQLADGQTLTNSIQNVAEGKTDIAGTPHILPFLMSKGVGPYGSLGKEKGAELAANLRAINPFTLGIFLLYAYDAKGVGGWDDLKGRKIYNGPPRGGALTNARSMIQIVGTLLIRVRPTIDKHCPPTNRLRVAVQAICCLKPISYTINSHTCPS